VLVVRQFSVLVQAARDVAGQWLAHCLNWDVVTQGDSPNHAIAMMCEALDLVIEADEDDDFDSSTRPAAPIELWREFSSIQNNGTRISPADANRLAAAPNLSYAITMLRVAKAEPKLVDTLPQLFVVQGLRDERHDPIR
jgi:predicted RNase H-like HicB family nuclease